MSKKNLKISHQLTIGFGSLLFIVAAISGVSIERINTVEDMLTTVSQVNNAKSQQAINYRGSVHDRAIFVRDVVYSDTLGIAQGHIKTINKLKDDYDAAKVKMHDLIKLNPPKTDKEREAYALIEKLEASITPKIDEIINLRMKGKVTEASERMQNELAGDFIQWLNSINAFLATQEEESKALTMEAHGIIASFLKMMAGLATLGLLIGVCSSLAISRGLRKQLGAEPFEVKAVADSIAKGDLTVHVPVSQNDKESLLRSMLLMQENLNKILNQVDESAHRMTLAANHVSESNQELSLRTDEQASSVEETSATMEQMTGTVRQNADNAKQANDLAQSASDVASRGGEVVEQVVTTMAEINESSKKIVDIISVIDSIAFQTNILALNAAVEAARAGEQGRGFAVVASEVRSLAQRSASAAKEIKQLIDDSVSKTNHGTERAEQAGKTMRDVVQSVQNVTQIMAEITHASNEQALGIEQISQAVNQMDRITRDNASLVQTSAQASTQLNSQTQELAQVVRQFKLKK